MVGTVKRCLRKVLGQSSFTDEQINTTLISIKAALNWSPITYSGDLDALTPEHFLIGGSLVTIPTGPETRKDLTMEFGLRFKLSENFWKLWQKEYLLQLRKFHDVRKPQVCRDVREGLFVLIQEDVPRGTCERKQYFITVRLTFLNQSVHGT